MRTIVLVPCGDNCPIGFLRSVISMRVSGEINFTFAQGSLVYDARNQLANIAIDGGYDRALWLDSDMQFPADLFEKLNEDMDEGREFVSGLYISRKKPLHTIVYSDVGIRDGIPRAEVFQSWPDDIFEIAACGFGAVMCSVPLLRRVRDKFKLPFSPLLGFGEDLSFCMRVKDLGVKMYCDPRIPLGHIGQAVYTVESMQSEMKK